MNDTSDKLIIDPSEAYLKSTFYEQLVEHVFISEVLQEIWYRFGKTAEVLRSEIDSTGYDLVFECNDIVRYIQLKTSTFDGKASGQKVNIALAKKPGGCVVWLVRHEDQQICRMKLSYRFFGSKAGDRLPSLDDFKVAKHTKANALGVKGQRTAIRVIPRSKFEKLASTTDLVERLFNLRT